MHKIDLDRFLNAQQPIFDQVKRELWSGQKHSHWMWFIFPQLRGLGHSPKAHLYAIASKEEAFKYAAHAVLGSRLIECTSIVLSHGARRPADIFGDIDAMKFQSSMTLFAAVAGKDSVFATALAKFYDSTADGRTLALLRQSIVTDLG